ncbi:hypothetical protein P9578_03470 [Brevibacillus choshinensis]|uniref:hypothetical protein n=1 Tax=Brevibacillus choshinensis TaxID=54911 RepID=UPI002E1E5ABC|nr:hypothetical protein [Brevibacillus choshinensis]
MARKQKPIVVLPHKVYIRATGETVDMTPELREQVSKKCADALVRWAKGEVMKDLGIG